MAIEARPTDSVRLSLSSTSKLTGKIDLERFGEVCRIDVIESSSSEEEARLLEVSFFDVRAAVAAKAAFGDSCSFAPQHGQRHLRLLGSAGLEVAELSGVSNISQTEEGDFVVEFFDSRSAAKAANFAYAQLMPNEGSTQSTPSPPPTKVTRPRKVHDLMMSQLRWEDLASNREWRTALQLRGLPKVMCDTRILKAFLEANGLLDLVASVRVMPTKGKQLGCAIVNAKAVRDVPKLAKFFHGRQLCSGGMPISVSFAAIQMKDRQTRLQKKIREKAAESNDIDCGGMEWTRGTTDLPWHVDESGISHELATAYYACSENAWDTPCESSGTSSGSASDVAFDEARHTLLPFGPPPGLEMYGQ
mmetsp:Transcript_108068/g.230753  ORF Transcript_108068/g.230753 Transcript_108068/m.230753 type:complete len:361 (-) Transcript_108068:143-1225(-)